MKQEDIRKSQEVVLSQTKEAHTLGVVDCAGEYVKEGTEEIYRCQRRLELQWMYRCWFCGKWLCPECARAHFGDR